MATRRYNRKGGGKHAAVAGLFVMASLITLAGLAFGVYAWVYRVEYAVLNTAIPGWIFAAVVVFLGARYFISVLKLRKRLMEADGDFNWSNFKPNKMKTGKMEG